jgi:hypothetical protein
MAFYYDRNSALSCRNFDPLFPPLAKNKRELYFANEKLLKGKKSSKPKILAELLENLSNLIS